MRGDSRESQRQSEPAPSEPAMLGTPVDASDLSWQRDQELHQTLRSTLSREFRELGERLKQDAREDLRRFVDEHAVRLQKALEQRPGSAGKPPSVVGKPPRNPLPASVGNGPYSNVFERQVSPGAASEVSANCISLPVPDFPSVFRKNSGASSVQSFSDLQAAKPPGCIAEHPEQDPATLEVQRPHNVWMNSPKVLVNRGIRVDARSSQAQAFGKWQKSRRKSRGMKGMSSTINEKVERKASRDRRLAELLDQAPSKDERSWRGLLSSLRLYLVAAVSNDYFDYAMGAVLMLNAIFIGIQADIMAASAQESTEVPQFFKACNAIFCVAFTLELAARIAVDGWRFWNCFNDGWKWNWFDTVVVFFAILDELSQALLDGTEVQEAISSVGIIRLLRLARVARLVRMVRLIPELKSMVYLIMASMSSFIWTTLLMMMMAFCFAVYFTELATEMVSNNPNSDMTDVKRCWGSLGQSILSLFQAMTGGDDWRNFVDVFDRPESSFLFNAVIFSIYIAFTTLVMLNLVTGVFVEGAQRIMREDRHEALMKLASKVFIDADMDCSASLQKEEFDALLDGHLMDDFLRETGLKKTEAHRLFYVFDEDNSGDLSLMEFVGGCIRMNSAAKSADVAELRYQQKVISEQLATRLQSLEETMVSLGEFLAGGRPGSASSAVTAKSYPSSCGLNGSGRLRAPPAARHVASSSAWTSEAEAGQQVPESEVDECFWA